MSSTDATLLERWVAHRDAEAFAEIVTRHAGMVYATCARILRDASQAEDATQECFLKLSRTEGPVRSLGGWLHQVATRRCLDLLRSDRRRKGREWEYAWHAPGQVEPPWDDVQDLVDEAIQELPEELRLPLIYHFLEGRSHEATGQVLGLSRSAVTRRIQRGIEGVRATLKNRGVGITTASLAAGMASTAADAASPSIVAALGKLALAGTAGAAKASGVGTLILLLPKALVGVAALALISALVYTSGTWPSRGNEADPSRVALLLGEGIEDLPFLEIEQNRLPHMLAQIEIEGEEEVSEAQLQNLLTVLAENLWAFRSGSIDAILADRLRAPYRFIPERAAAARQAILQQPGLSDRQVPADTEALLRLWAVYQGGATGYTDLFRELSPEGSMIAFRKSDSLRVDLATELSRMLRNSAAADRPKGMGVGMNGHLSSIEYENSPEKILTVQGELLYADIRLATRDASGEACMRLKRYYWSPDDACWLAIDIAALNASQPAPLEFF